MRLAAENYYGGVNPEKPGSQPAGKVSPRKPVATVQPLAQSHDYKVTGNTQHSQYSSSEAPKTVSAAAKTEHVAGVGVSDIRAQELEMNTSMMSQTQVNQREQSSYMPIESQSSATANVN